MYLQKNHIENRKHPRVNKRIPFKLETENSSIVAKTINLSCIGAYCMASKPIPFMTNLKIAFTLPDYEHEKGTKHVECNGVVVRVEKEVSKAKAHNAYNIAIFFSEIEKSEKEKIATFIEMHMERSWKMSYHR